MTTHSQRSCAKLYLKRKLAFLLAFRTQFAVTAVYTVLLTNQKRNQCCTLNKRCRKVCLIWSVLKCLWFVSLRFKKWSGKTLGVHWRIGCWGQILWVICLKWPRQGSSVLDLHRCMCPSKENTQLTINRHSSGVKSELSHHRFFEFEKIENLWNESVFECRDQQFQNHF